MGDELERVSKNEDLERVSMDEIEAEDADRAARTRR